MQKHSSRFLKIKDAVAGTEAAVDVEAANKYLHLLSIHQP